jgi:hypothetical protein
LASSPPEKSWFSDADPKPKSPNWKASATSDSLQR